MKTKLGRQNRFGLMYILTEISDVETRIALMNKDGSEGKSIIVKAEIDDLSTAWFQWQMRGMFVQDAFYFLSPDEREFLMTGLLPVEFEAITKTMETGEAY
jgi:chloramphenicol 3-O-phosphotransferase